MSDITLLLDAAASGDRRAAAELLPLVYDELRKLAAASMAFERPDHTLNATALVHEAYLRLTREQSFASKGHFMRAAAEAMRRILVDHARRKQRLKRGGAWKRLDLDQVQAETTDHADDLIAVSEALEQLSQEDCQKAELVKLRYFAGMSVEDAAHYLGISRATADRWWTYSRAWLYNQLQAASPSESQEKNPQE
jgi:RNA polymerase sigma factor (TIGR02999 family)